MSLAAAKEKHCVICGKSFLPFTSMQTLCGRLKCAQALGRSFSKQRRESVLKERRQVRERRAALKTIPELIKEAQREFNAFIRERDRDLPCICCGRQLASNTGSSTGGEFDCGHYRSTGSAPHLRFDERNAHGQRKVCNRYGAGRAVDYRVGLIARIGLVHVESLEADNRIHKWTREELIGIRDTYRAKLKELRRGKE